MDCPSLDPRTNFLTDLKAFLHKHINTPHTNQVPIILGDWNEECNGTSTSQKLCDFLGLVDIWKYRNPLHQSFKKYLRGNRRIDFALTTGHLASQVINMVYKPFFYHTSGDHRGFYIDFELSSLFSTTVPTFGTASRGFSSKDRKAVTTYVTGFKAHMDAHNVYHRFNELLHTGLPKHDLMENIDQDIT